jgi:hypothetical protein
MIQCLRLGRKPVIVYGRMDQVIVRMLSLGVISLLALPGLPGASAS